MLNTLKKNLKAIPVVGTVLRYGYRKLIGSDGPKFHTSSQYWEDRYKLGGNSGSGSYGRLARFKADFLNSFVTENNISFVVEFGCGDGAQLELANYPRYVGFDVAPMAVQTCREKFSENKNYSFHLVNSEQFNTLEHAELSLSLDVIYHLIEDSVFEQYMRKLFESSDKFVIIYAYNQNKTYESQHEKGREFTSWIAEHEKAWKLIERIPNKYQYDPKNPNSTSQSDFFVYEKVY
jgi:trans-aconitate methyltransferase